MEVRAYYNGFTFVPTMPIKVRKNQKAIITVLEDTIETTEKGIFQKTPVFGCAKGRFHVADDFDAPLEDFVEYM